MIELYSLSAEIWSQNYKYTDERTVADTWQRMAQGAAAVENEEIRKTVERHFFGILENFKFIPGGRILANLGTNRKSTTLMNCFVHSPKDIGYKDPDSIEGIYEMLKAQAHTLKSEGGYGMNFSWIRPKGTYIHGIDSRTPGVIKFMELWDKSSEIITMGSDIKTAGDKQTEKNKIRKGAMMGILPVWHPEIIDFIKAKQTPNRLTKFNVSVGIFADFMKKVNDNEKWELKYPDTTFEKYEEEWNGNLYDWEAKGYPVIVYETIKARELWDLIMYSTYTRNEPGVIFFDIANRLNPLWYGEYIMTTNPCGEIIMSTGVCNLGSLNVTRFLLKNGEFDWNTFRETIRWSIRFLDNINDISNAPLPEYKRSMVEKRRIGLGVMGLGSLHFMMGMKYGSEESMEFIRRLYKEKAETELIASAELGKEKGSFQLFDQEKYFSSVWWKNLKIDNEVKNQIQSVGAMRNSHRSMNAPTGNTSILAEVVSGGIEPVFMKEYVRWSIVPEQERARLKKQGLKLPDVHSGEWHETEHFFFAQKGDEEVLKGFFRDNEYEIDRNRGLVKASLVEDYGWRYVKEHFPVNQVEELSAQGAFATTEELTVEEHIKVLEIISHYTDQNNSKTVNLPTEYSYEDFKKLYLEAWKSNIKGLTTYRAGTMTAVIEKAELESYQNELDELFSKSNGNVILDGVKLPREYNSKGYIIRDNHSKKWYVHIAFADSKYRKPFAIFVSTNHKETTEVADEVIYTLEELIRSKGIKEELIEHQRDKYAGQPNTVKIARAFGMALRHNIPIIEIIETLDKFDVEFSSFVYHLKKLLAKFIKDGTKVKGEECPSCHRKTTIIYQEGCKMCKNCGFSAC